MKKLLLLLSLIFLLTNVSISPAAAQAGAEITLNADPEKAQIITSDIDLFWKAYDIAKPENNLNVFRDEYLRKGSVGLKEFTRTRISSSCELADAIESHPKYYASIRETTLKAHTFREPIRATFRKLKEIYPAAVFPDVYFLVGRMNSGGTYTNKALLIGVEMYGRTADTPTDELGEWHQQVIKGIDGVPHIVAHELIHYQQKFPEGDRPLLGRVIGEGSADFISELISGKHVNDHLHRYGDAREKELWAELQKSIAANDMSLWLYNGGQIKDRPADLGYYMGYKIAKSYYDNAADKKQAVKDILEIKDFNAFLKASRYEEKFASK